MKKPAKQKPRRLSKEARMAATARNKAAVAEFKEWCKGKIKTYNWTPITKMVQPVEEQQEEEEEGRAARLYRMAKCKNCPYKCKPCLYQDEVHAIMKANGVSWQGTGICQLCHARSVKNALKTWERETKRPELVSLETQMVEFGKLLASVEIQ
jgi:superfamily II helicase